MYRGCPNLHHVFQNCCTMYIKNIYFVGKNFNYDDFLTLKDVNSFMGHCTILQSEYFKNPTCTILCKP